MKNLTSISEHSDYLEKTFTFDTIKWDLHLKRVEFGKHPLEKWMFVPCDLIKGKIVVLNEVDEHYQQAKERCLFEGFEYISSDYDYPFDLIAMEDKISIHCDRLNESTIEDLVKCDLELTKTAQKQIGL